MNITCPNAISGSIYNVLSQRRGNVFDAGEGVAGGVAQMKAYLPVAGRRGHLRGGDFKDPLSRLGKIIRVYAKWSFHG